MELLTLDSSFHEDRMIENYESLIWTERYAKAGDFQLISSDIAGTIKALPEESYVTLRDSTVVMKVEVHKITKAKDKESQITVTGRTFEACALELRSSVKTALGGVRSAWTVNAAKESDAAYEVMRTVIGDTARYQSNIQILPILDPAVSLLDAIPEVDLILPADYKVVLWDAAIDFGPNEVVIYSGSLYISATTGGGVNHVPSSSPTYWTLMSSAGALSSSAPINYDIKPGNLYTTVMELLDANHHGLKSVKPLPYDGGQVGIEIYNGADLTSGPDALVFDARFDQIDDATYVLSQTGSTNIAYVYGSASSQQVDKTTYDISHPEPSGLSRRVLLVDLVSDATVSTSDLKSRGLIELYKNNATALFGGQVAVQVAADYNKKYFLGDILKLNGEYGLSQNVRVAEFIRSSDSSGEKAYPTFEAVD